MRDNGKNAKKTLLLALPLLLAAFSCNKTGDGPENAAIQAAETAPAAQGPSAQGPSAQGRAAIMIRGNNWVSGVPGLGTNVFSALAGDYRLEGPNAGGSHFSAYATGTLLYLSDEWKGPEAGSSALYRKAGDEGEIITSVLEDSHGNLWTVIFVFPRGLEGCGLDTRSFNMLFGAWTNRLLYYISQAAAIEEISLPAVVDF